MFLDDNNVGNCFSIDRVRCLVTDNGCSEWTYRAIHLHWRPHTGETCRHFKTSTEEHIKKDNKPHIFKHLHSTTTCFDSNNSLCFEIIDKANSKFDLKIKEALHVNWSKPN